MISLWAPNNFFTALILILAVVNDQSYLNSQPSHFPENKNLTVQQLDSLLQKSVQSLESEPAATLRNLNEALQSAEYHSDSLLLSRIYLFQSICHFYLDDTLKQRELYNACAEISIPYGLRADIDFKDSLRFYNWAFNSWLTCLEVFEESESQISFDQILSEEYQKKFNANYTPDFNPEKHYWIRTIIRGCVPGDKLLFSVGGGIHSWDQIDIYYDNYTDEWVHKLSGNKRIATEKTVRDAFNYFELPVTKQNHTIYLRLEGANIDYPVTSIFLNHIDRELDIELNGYRFPGLFVHTDADKYEFTTIQRSIEIVKEKGQSFSIEFVHENWDQLEPRMKDFLPIDKKSNYWMKFKAIGTPQNGGIGNQLFMIGDKEFSWPSIDIYKVNSNGNIEHSKTGFDIPTKRKSIQHGYNLFELDLRPNDTSIVYLYFKKSNKKFVPDGFTLAHLDSLKFWRKSNQKGLMGGLVYGAIWIQALFFFLLAIIEKEKMHIFYATFLIATSTFFVSFDTFFYLQVFPSLVTFKPIAYLISQFFIAFGLLKFADCYLELETLSFDWKTLIKGLLVIMGILTAWEFIQFLNNKTYDLYYADNWISNSKLILFMSSFLLISLLSIVKIRKGFKPAIYFLFAIATFVVASMLLLIVGLYDLDTIFESSLMFTQLSLLLMVILLSLGSGYRTLSLKLDRQQALEDKIASKDRFLKASGKFVPHEFIKTLGRDDITEVVLGDHVEKEVTILFSDIRDYTSLAEGMSPSQTYSFIKKLNEKFGPAIHNNNGFINDYTGDGIMAIFPESPTDALIAAIKIQKTLHKLNEERLSDRKKEISLGIGLHTGSLVMGIIGDNERMAATTISDAVNTASRIESLTKHYGVKILLSNESLVKIQSKQQYNFRFLGKVQLKGKLQPISVYEVLDGETEDTRLLKLKVNEQFENGMKAYLNKDFSKAKSFLEEVLKVTPQDKVSNKIMSNINRLETYGIPENWSGIETMDKK